jgi:transposase
MEVNWEGRRYVIAGGPWRQKRDAERRAARLAKAEARLEQLAAVQRKRVNPQKLASQVGRALQQLGAHKYFDYWVDQKGRLEWQRKTDLIQAEEELDGWYLLSTNLAVEDCDGRQTLARYQNLLQVEEAFGQLKSYLEVRPVFHWRPDRVRNHVRICFLAYWISARLGLEWRQRGEKGEVPRLLRQLQSIRLGVLAVKNRQLGAKITRVPKPLNDLLKKLGLLHLFAQPPSWVTV